jgi:hypothetical protein
MTHTPTTADLVGPWLELLADLRAETLPDETEEERGASGLAGVPFFLGLVRQAACADILDDLLETSATGPPTLASTPAADLQGIRTCAEVSTATIGVLVTANGDRITVLADAAA